MDVRLNSMEHCLECNSTLKSDERECWGCGAIIPDKNAKASYNERFRRVVQVMFLIFLVLTVASLFLDALPFWRCVAALVVIYLVKSSADYMAKTKNG